MILHFFVDAPVAVNGVNSNFMVSGHHIASTVNAALLCAII